MPTKQTEKLKYVVAQARRRLSLLLSVLLFFIVFESIAQLSQEIRKVRYYADLSENHGSEIPVLSDEEGARANLYRGQKERWAVFGTSFTQGYNIPQHKTWTTILEQLLKGKVHIRNFSAPGGFNTTNELIKQQTQSGKTYDKVLISVVLDYDSPEKSPELLSLFPNTGRFFLDKSDSLIIAPQLVRQILIQNQFSAFKPIFDFWNLILRHSTISPAMADPRNDIYIDPTHTDDFISCNFEQMHLRHCAEQFKGRGDQYLKHKTYTKEQLWNSYETDYLKCQKEADIACGIYRRHDGWDPAFTWNGESYYEQLSTIIKNARKLSSNIFLISRSLAKNEITYPYTLVSNNSITIFYLNRGKSTTPLSTRASAKFEETRNAEFRKTIRRTIKNWPRLNFLDFEKWFDQESQKSGTDINLFPESYFGDYVHLSEKGEQALAHFLVSELDKEKK